MIFKLVIGRWLGYKHEITCGDAAHPHVIREWIEQAQVSPERYIICTHSPTTIRAVIDFWDKDPLMYEWIYLRPSSAVRSTQLTCDKDIPLLSIKHRDWLVHFALEDLYILGEFDDVLKEP